METLKKLPISVLLSFAFLVSLWILGLIFFTTPFVILTAIIGVIASLYRIAFFFHFDI